MQMLQVADAETVNVYRGADALVLLFDITKQETLDAALKQLQSIPAECWASSRSFFVILVATHADAPMNSHVIDKRSATRALRNAVAEARSMAGGTAAIVKASACALQASRATNASAAATGSVIDAKAIPSTGEENHSKVDDYTTAVTADGSTGDDGRAVEPDAGDEQNAEAGFRSDGGENALIDEKSEPSLLREVSEDVTSTNGSAAVKPATTDVSKDSSPLQGCDSNVYVSTLPEADVLKQGTAYGVVVFADVRDVSVIGGVELLRQVGRCAVMAAVRDGLLARADGVSRQGLSMWEAVIMNAATQDVAAMTEVNSVVGIPRGDKEVAVVGDASSSGAADPAIAGIPAAAAGPGTSLAALAAESGDAFDNSNKILGEDIQANTDTAADGDVSVGAAGALAATFGRDAYGDATSASGRRVGSAGLSPASSLAREDGATSPRSTRTHTPDVILPSAATLHEAAVASNVEITDGGTKSPVVKRNGQRVSNSGGIGTKLLRLFGQRKAPQRDLLRATPMGNAASLVDRDDDGDSGALSRDDAASKTITGFTAAAKGRVRGATGGLGSPEGEEGGAKGDGRSRSRPSVAGADSGVGNKRMSIFGRVIKAGRFAAAAPNVPLPSAPPASMVRTGTTELGSAGGAFQGSDEERVEPASPSTKQNRLRKTPARSSAKLKAPAARIAGIIGGLKSEDKSALCVADENFDAWLGDDSCDDEHETNSNTASASSELRNSDGDDSESGNEPPQRRTAAWMAPTASKVAVTVEGKSGNLRSGFGLPRPQDQHQLITPDSDAISEKEEDASQSHEDDSGSDGSVEQFTQHAQTAITSGSSVRGTNTNALDHRTGTATFKRKSDDRDVKDEYSVADRDSGRQAAFLNNASASGAKDDRIVTTADTSRQSRDHSKEAVGAHSGSAAERALLPRRGSSAAGNGDWDFDPAVGVSAGGLSFGAPPTYTEGGGGGGGGAGWYRSRK